MPPLLYMLCDTLYNIQNYEYLIFDIIFDSSTSVNFTVIKSNNNCWPLLCNLYMLNWRFEPPFMVLIPTSHGQMHRLIPPCQCSGASVCLHLHIQAANALMCLMTYFYRLAWAFIAGQLKSNVLINLIFYLRYYLSSI